MCFCAAGPAALSAPALAAQHRRRRIRSVPRLLHRARPRWSDQRSGSQSLPRIHHSRERAATARQAAASRRVIKGKGAAMNNRSATVASTIPFDTKKLDDLLEQAGIDVLIATSKHNVGYLLGGYRFFFFETMDAIGINRYLPVFIYAKGHADRSVFIGNKLEGFEKQLNRFWTGVAETSWMTGPEAMHSAVLHVRKMGVASARIGVESAFLPLDAADVLHSAFPDSRLVDATMALERLRARKSASELSLIKKASESVVAAMQATFSACRPGMTKHDVVAHLRRA